MSSPRPCGLARPGPDMAPRAAGPGARLARAAPPFRHGRAPTPRSPTPSPTVPACPPRARRHPREPGRLPGCDATAPRLAARRSSVLGSAARAPLVRTGLSAAVDRGGGGGGESGGGRGRRGGLWRRPERGAVEAASHAGEMGFLSGYNDIISRDSILYPGEMRVEFGGE